VLEGVLNFNILVVKLWKYSFWLHDLADAKVLFKFDHISSHCLLFRAECFSKHIRVVVPKVCSADRKGSPTSSQGIRGYSFIIAVLKFAYFFLTKEIMFC
jgi:hypothetical protein